MKMNSGEHVLVLGIGNVLMGDEGVGVEVVRQVSRAPLPGNVECLDGGTGSFLLLESMQRANRVILIDATIDGSQAGTVTRLTPQFSSDYPPTLTAHDIGLKDLLDSAYLTGAPLHVTLFAISIDPDQIVGISLSPVIAARVSEITRQVLVEVLALCGVENTRRRRRLPDPPRAKCFKESTVAQLFAAAKYSALE